MGGVRKERRRQHEERKRVGVQRKEGRRRSERWREGRKGRREESEK